MDKVVGVDIGGVIAAHRSMVEAGRDVPRVPNAFEGIAYLAGQQTVRHLYVISMCDEPTEQASRAWLLRNKFYEETGVSESDVFYCREHKDKAGLAFELELTNHIDDRLEVFSHFPDGIDMHLFRPRAKEVAKFANHLPRVRIEQSWVEMAARIVS